MNMNINFGLAFLLIALCFAALGVALRPRATLLAPREKWFARTATKSGWGFRHFRRNRLALLLAIGMAAPITLLTGCNSGIVTTSNGVTTISTAALDANVKASAYLISQVEAIPAIAAQLAANPTAKAKLDDFVTKATTTSTTIEKSTSGTVTLTTGKAIAADITSALEAALQVAQPIVAHYDPSVSNYLTLGSQLVTYLNALFSTGGSLQDAAYGATQNALVIQRVWAGPDAIAAK